MRRLGILAAVALVIGGPAASGKPTSATAGCVEKLVDTLSVKVPGAEVTSKDLEVGATYRVNVTGNNNDLLLRINDVPISWAGASAPGRDRATLGLTVAPSGIALGLGARAVGHIGLVQATNNLAGKNTCYVEPDPSWTGLPGTALRFTPDPAETITRSLTVQIYQYVLNGTSPPTGTQPGPERYSLGFAGGHTVGNPTIRTGEERVWSYVSGVGRVEVGPTGAVAADGGGSIEGIYMRNKKATIRQARFVIVSADRPPATDNTLYVVRARVTSSTFNDCPRKGDAVTFQMTQGYRNNSKGRGFIGVTSSCIKDAYPLFGVGYAIVTVRRVGG